jgi:outer membrane protein assembly factor BamB
MRLLLPLSFAALLIAAGCSKDKDVEPPAALVKDFKSTLPVKKLWSEGIGGGKKQIKLRLGLGPAIDNGLVFAASHKGEIVAVALETGRNVWVKKLKVPISAGPAAGSGIVVAGSSKGAVIALDGATGRQLWRSQINSELLSSPAISENVVVIRSVDGRLHGLETRTGKALWSVEQQVPRLSLRGTAIPIVAKEVAISGFDNGKVMAVSLTTGDTIWDTGSARRYRFGRSSGRRQCIRGRVSGAHGDARARFGTTLVVARHVELSWLGGGCRQSICHRIRRHGGGDAPARRRRTVAQRKDQAPRIEFSDRHQHGDRRR